jgi:hypothetical protein
MSDVFGGSVWPLGEEWPTSALPPPTLTVEISVVELEGLIEDHAVFAADAAERRDYNTEAFHVARASYLRQRLASVASHRLTPNRKGHA